MPALTGAVLAGSPVCPALGALARLSRLRGGAPAWVPVLQVPGQAAGAGRPLGLPPPPASLSRPPSAFEAVCFRWAVLLRRRGWVPARAAAQTVGHSAALRGAAGCPKLAGCRSGAHAPPARVVLARGVAAGGPCPSGQRPAGQKVPFTPSVRLRRTAPPSRGSCDGRANQGPHASPAKRVAWGEDEQGSGARNARQGVLSGADFARTTSRPTQKVVLHVSGRAATGRPYENAAEHVGRGGDQPPAVTIWDHAVCGVRRRPRKGREKTFRLGRKVFLL